jgi:RHH-type transcriptional regulator, rel operon repressor / antitoxin RelB
MLWGHAMLALELPKDLEERLHFMASKAGQSTSLFARQAIIEKIEELEDILLLKKALAESDGTSVSWEEAMKEWDIQE